VKLPTSAVQPQEAQIFGTSRFYTGKVDSGFTLAEVIISLGILGVVFGGAMLFYLSCSQRAEWSAHSLAAQSIASQGAEQARAAKWDPQAWPQLVGPNCADELGVTNYTQTNALDIPVNGKPVMATNLVSITSVSASPPIRQIRSDCIWSFPGRGQFTNTVITLRAADQ
jgi:prepilin-type N-terminal cleavage/methylation domain-containing protein